MVTASSEVQNSAYRYRYMKTPRETAGFSLVAIYVHYILIAFLQSRHLPGILNYIWWKNSYLCFIVNGTDFMKQRSSSEYLLFCHRCWRWFATDSLHTALVRAKRSIFTMQRSASLISCLLALLRLCRHSCS